ncbi:unnamed protein product [Cochlearia groenlandica]
MEEVSESSRGDSADVATAGEGDGGDAMATGLSAMIETVIRDFDSKAIDTVNSQDRISSSLDRLVQELDQLLENAPLPFIIQHASKITSVRQRVSSLNILLKSIQRRIDNIDHMISSANVTQVNERNEEQKSSETR